MFAVVFEVHPAEGKTGEYLAHAKELKPIIETIDGFIDNERFESRSRSAWIVSLSTWRDEKSVIRWRTQSKHHGVQELGRAGVLADYHLRVCEITADTHPPAGYDLKEQRFDQTEVGSAKALAITELSPAPGAALRRDEHALAGLDRAAEGLTGHGLFESIYNPGKMLLLSSWTTADLARSWQPVIPAGMGALRHRTMRVIRDYGMTDRRETPQYYPPVARREAASSSMRSGGIT